MSDERPTVDPLVVSTSVDGAPDRVRRRLDRSPDAANSWQWKLVGDEWTVAAGNETVRLPARHVGSIEQVSCSCLLAPNCFHVMACLTALEADSESDDRTGEIETDDDIQTDPSEDADTIRPSEIQQQAAADLTESIHRLVGVGITGAGVAVQSGLIRAVHQCRAAGLHRAAAVGLRVIEGTRQVRQRTNQADPLQLADDLTDCMQTAHHIKSGNAINSFWVGTARRKQHPVRPKRLHGIFAEPILTRSGFAGVAVYLLGEDDQIYSVSDVRPGNAELCRGAYRGGIDIGPIVEPAIKLARTEYLTSEMTASGDGRLGRGQSVKIAAQGSSTWDASAIGKRFGAHLTDQWDRIYQQTSLPPDVRPAGWDFVFVCGSILGAAGAELLLDLPREETVVRLAIANDSEDLCFRENLRMLSHAPGLTIRVVGRLDLNQPTTIEALAIEPFAVAAEASATSSPESAPPRPRLDLPEPAAGRINLGLDPIPRHCLIDAQAGPIVLGGASHPPVVDPLASLRRRWVAMMLGGTSSQHRTVTNTIAGEIRGLHRSGFATGASLLDAIARQEKAGLETFLATGIYLRRCTAELAKSQATLK